MYFPKFIMGFCFYGQLSNWVVFPLIAVCYIYCITDECGSTGESDADFWLRYAFAVIAECYNIAEEGAWQRRELISMIFTDTRKARGVNVKSTWEVLNSFAVLFWAVVFHCQRNSYWYFLEEQKISYWYFLRHESSKPNDMGVIEAAG